MKKKALSMWVPSKVAHSQRLIVYDFSRSKIWDGKIKIPNDTPKSQTFKLKKNSLVIKKCSETLHCDHKKGNLDGALQITQIHPIVLEMEEDGHEKKERHCHVHLDQDPHWRVVS